MCQILLELGAASDLLTPAISYIKDVTNTYKKCLVWLMIMLTWIWTHYACIFLTHKRSQISTTKSSKNHGILFLELPACALPSLLNSRILQCTPPKQIHPPCLPNNVPAHASQLSRLGYGQGQLCFPSELYTSAWSLGNHLIGFSWTVSGIVELSWRYHERY